MHKAEKEQAENFNKINKEAGKFIENEKVEFGSGKTFDDYMTKTEAKMKEIKSAV